MLLVVIVAITLTPGVGLAYIGPGAGFTLLSSFLVFLSTLVVVFFSLLVWPLRAMWRWFRFRGRPAPWVRRVIIVGIDGQDPKLTNLYMRQGKLPNFERLQKLGCYRDLATTFPSISPVAWSSFCTGVQPGKHNIFDFLDRDPRSYVPRLSSTSIGKVERVLRLGRWRVPLGKPALRLLRKSKAFWTVLGEKRIWSTILRVPITFPPERFHGAQLSAMCVPDLLGTQGTFLLYTTRPAERRFKEGGIRVSLPSGADRFDTMITGPENTFVAGNPPLQLPMSVELDRAKKCATVRVSGNTIQLVPGVLSKWLTLRFPAAPLVKVNGLCRMMVSELDEHFSLYVTPITIDPEKPAMPISNPAYYSNYLAKKIGPYSTLGLAEDTWALNENVVDDTTFLQQAYDIDAERQRMFFAALGNLRQGCLVCVFDAADRIQHTFWRYIENGHPAARGRDPGAHANAIEDIYRHNDVLVGRVLDQVRDGDLVMVLSDHGFTSFRRGVNLNTWLHQNGYLALSNGAPDDSEWLANVDWTRTRAYALGLSGVFLNRAGREAAGTVGSEDEATALKQELMEKLGGLVDDDTGEVAINEVFDTQELYHGPYGSNAPDLIVGYNAGYRISWDGATGVLTDTVFEDNTKAWSGDHCVDPRLVPGVFFCNRDIQRDDPSLVDVAPTVLRLFGIAPPPYMEGRCLFDGPGAVNGKSAPGARAQQGDS